MTWRYVVRRSEQRIFDALAYWGPERTVTQLAEVTGLSWSIVQHRCAAMARIGLLHRRRETPAEQAARLAFIGVSAPNQRAHYLYRVR